jgi:hypothetical protein
MRLSLLSDDNEIADLLINKALELLSQAETAAEADQMKRSARANDGRGSSDGPNDTY